MLTWSLLATLCLIVVGLSGSAGLLLWPAVVVHAVIIVLLLQAAAKVGKPANLRVIGSRHYKLRGFWSGGSVTMPIPPKI